MIKIFARSPDCYRGRLYDTFENRLAIYESALTHTGGDRGGISDIRDSVTRVSIKGKYSFDLSNELQFTVIVKGMIALSKGKFWKR